MNNELLEIVETESETEKDVAQIVSDAVERDLRRYPQRFE